MPIVTTVFLLTMFSLTAFAEERTWLPDQLPKIGPALETAVLETPPEDFADLTGQPMGAIATFAWRGVNTRLTFF